MAEQIGIRLSLSGAQQVTSGLDNVSRSLGTLDARTVKIGDALRGLGGTLVAALSVGTITQWVRSAIDAADQAGKLAQTIGVATEQVAGLQLAFRQSGLQAEQLAPIMSKLAAATANGNKALEAMNVATRNADGSLRSTRQVLGDVADRFAGYADGASKTALAVALLGEEGAKLVPLLNGGAAGLADMDAKARALGLTLDADAARAAAKFNDELDLFKARAEGVARTIAIQLLPTLNKLIGQLNDGAAAYGSFWAATIDIGLKVDPFKSLNENLADTVKEIQTYKAIIDELNARTGPDVFGRRAAQVEKYQQTLERAIARERYLLQQLKAEGGRSGNPLVTSTGLGQAPPVGAGAADKLGDFMTTQLAAQRQRELDAMVKAQADATKAIMEDMDRQAKAADALARAEEEWVARGRKAREDAAKASADSAVQRLAELQDEERAIAIAAQQNVTLAEAIEMVAIARLYEQSVGLDAADPRAAAIDREIQAREKLLQLMRDRGVRDANKQAADQAARDWAQVTQQIGQSLTDALMNGSMKAGDFIKNLFKTMVLRPVIQAVMNPVMGAIGGAMGMTGTAAAATGGGAAGGAMNAAGMAASLAGYGGLFGAGATMALTGGTSAALSAAGAAMSAGSFGGGLAIGAGALAPWVIGGMILIQGLSRKLKDVGVQGTFGGDAGFTGEQYRFYKGGFLRSDKTSTSALDAEMQNLLSGSFLQIRESTATMARELGLSADALDGFTKDIKLSLKGLTEEQIQQKLAQEFGALGDEMARLVAGSGATRQSLEQLYQSVLSQREQLEVRLLELQGNTVALRERERAAIHETNRALYDQVIALQDTQAAAQAAADAEAQLAAERDRIAQERDRIAQERASLNRQLMELRGDTAAIRAEERAALDQSNRALFDRINLLQDARAAEEQAALASQQAAEALRNLISSLQSDLAAAQAERLQIAQRVVMERDALEQRLLQLQGDAVALREREIAALDPLNQAFARFVFAAEDAKTATDALAQRMTALADAGSSIATFIAELRAGTATGSSLSALRAAYESTLSRAQGGDVSASGEIVGAARAMLDAAQSRARTRAEADLMAARVAAELEALPATKSFQQQQAEAMQTLVDQGAAAALANADAQAALLKATTDGFAYLDTTTDGLLTLDELKTGLAGIATDAQIKALIARVDTNADGQIDELELLRALTGNVDENTLNTLRENETQVASLRSLVAETIVNSSKLTTLNGTIQSLTTSIGQLTSVSQAQASATQTQIASQISGFNTQGSAQAQSLTKLQQQYQKLYDKALDEFFTSVWFSTSGQRLTEQEKQLTGGNWITTGLASNAQVGKVDKQLALDILSKYSMYPTLFDSNGNLYLSQTPIKFDFPTYEEMLAGNLLNQSSGPLGMTTQADGINDAEALEALLGNIATVQNAVNELRAAITALGGTPTFATGGFHTGGLRLVGEQGPELEVTGPARYWNASDTMSMLGNAGRREEVLVAEIRALRNQVAKLEAVQLQTAVNTGKTQRLMQRVTRDGESLLVTDVTPAP